MILATTETIFIPLIDEGTDVARPTQGEPLGGGVFRVLATEGYDSEDEIWQFPPGSIVLCGTKLTSLGTVLMAEKLQGADSDS